MSGMEWGVWSGIAIAVLVAWWLGRRAAARTSESHWLPRELQGARLKFAEQTFRSWRTTPLVARVDRGYELHGVIHLAEFKTRAFNRAYRSDIIELSAQRLAIEESTEERVSDMAYVFILDPTSRKRSVQKVRLMGKSEVLLLMRRRIGILDGRIEPACTKTEGLCHDCGFRNECRPDLEKFAQRI